MIVLACDFCCFFFFFFKQKTAYEMRISDWSSDVCSSDLLLFDTAGLRRKMRVEGRAETLSVGDALKAIRFAEIVVLLLDAEQQIGRASCRERVCQYV